MAKLHASVKAVITQTSFFVMALTHVVVLSCASLAQPQSRWFWLLTRKAHRLTSNWFRFQLSSFSSHRWTSRQISRSVRMCGIRLCSIWHVTVAVSGCGCGWLQSFRLFIGLCRYVSVLHTWLGNDGSVEQC